MNFSQTTPTTSDSAHSKPPAPPPDVKEMNFDPIASRSSGSGLLANMEIHRHDNPPAAQGGASTVAPAQQQNAAYNARYNTTYN